MGLAADLGYFPLPTFFVHVAIGQPKSMSGFDGGGGLAKARQLLLFGLSPSAPLGCCIASEKKSPRPGGEGRKSHTKGWRQTRTPACDSQRDASPCSNFPTSK